ncbi:hypothetical protein IID19_03520 [Patescibacteria group bacterium]|nr:hypothetical protein [Patescibacteria group bacterium]
MYKKSITIVVATLFLSALLFIPTGSSALSLDPAILEIDLTAGAMTVAPVTLENDTLETLSLETEVVMFTVGDETGQPEFAFGETPSGIATWVDVDAGPINLKPGSTEVINITFDTPAGATPGGYYVAVFFNQASPSDEGGSVMIESKVGTLFLATVAGSYTQSGKIAEFSSSGESTMGDQPVDFTVRFQNTGDVHLKPTGTITVTSMMGNIVKTITVNSDKGAVLPGTIREFEVAPWSDIGNAFGKYTVELTMSDGTVTDSQVLEFWFFSAVGIVIGIVVILVIIFAIVMMAKSSGKRKTDQV